MYHSLLRFDQESIGEFTLAIMFNLYIGKSLSVNLFITTLVNQTLLGHNCSTSINII